VTPIGLIDLHPEAKKDMQHHRNAEVGIQIKEEYQWKGYGTEAIEWILMWAFKYGALHRVAMTSFSYSPGARRLYERLGFVYEGSQREALWFDGGWHDLVFQSMLADEWLKGSKRVRHFTMLVEIGDETLFHEEEKDTASCVWHEIMYRELIENVLTGGRLMNAMFYPV
jgi:hypothetical protein